MDYRILPGDSRESLAVLPAGSVHCAVTSPPYFGLRAYKAGDREIGRESTVAAYLDGLLAVFREVRRVLRDDGLLWVNLGTSYCTAKGSCFNPGGGADSMARHADGKTAEAYPLDRGNKSEWAAQSYKPGDLIDIPSLFAEAMRLDGWYLRSRITWVKGVSCADDYSGSCMPESAAANGTYWVRHRITTKPCTASVDGDERASRIVGRDTDPSRGRNPGDSLKPECQRQTIACPGCAKCSPHGGYILKRGNGRPTNSTEVVLMFAKTDSYFYDAEAVKEQSHPETWGLNRKGQYTGKAKGDYTSGDAQDPSATKARIAESAANGGRCLRSAWWMPLENSTDAWFINPGGNSDVAGKHFAMFPMALPTLCIKQSTSERGVCPKCGAPWARVIDRTAQNRTRLVGAGVDSPDGTAGRAGELSCRTLDWRPTCGCKGDDNVVGVSSDGGSVLGAGSGMGVSGGTGRGLLTPVPATVLDPFSGMATTGVAALRLGRNYIGCELNGDYSERSRARLEKVAADKGLF